MKRRPPQKPAPPKLLNTDKMSNSPHTSFHDKMPEYMAKNKEVVCIGEGMYAVNSDGKSIKKFPVALQRAGMNNATHNLKAMTLAQRLKKKLDDRKNIQIVLRNPPN